MRREEDKGRTRVICLAFFISRNTSLIFLERQLAILLHPLIGSFESFRQFIGQLELVVLDQMFTSKFRFHTAKLLTSSLNGTSRIDVDRRFRHVEADDAMKVFGRTYLRTERNESSIRFCEFVTKPLYRKRILEIHLGVG